TPLQFIEKLDGGLAVVVKRRRIIPGLYAIGNELPAEFAEAAVSVVNGLFDIFVVNKPVADLFTFFHFVVVHLPVEDERTAPAQRRFHDFARFFVLLL